MNSTTSWTPSPQLAMATAQALAIFARHWPRAMAVGIEATDAGRVFLNDYARALLGTDLSAIPEAAQLWVSENKLPPRPASFAKFAREVAKGMRPPQYGEPLAPLPPPPLEPSRDAAMVNTISERAHKALGSWSIVSEVWELLNARAKTPKALQMVRDGTVPTAVVDKAIADVRKRREAKRHE